MLKCPCHYCKKRAIGCHGRCREYDEYKTERIKIKKDLKDAVDIARRANRYSG